MFQDLGSLNMSHPKQSETMSNPRTLIIGFMTLKLLKYISQTHSTICNWWLLMSGCLKVAWSKQCWINASREMHIHVQLIRVAAHKLRRWNMGQTPAPNSPSLGQLSAAKEQFAQPNHGSNYWKHQMVATWYMAYIYNIYIYIYNVKYIMLFE